jgi:hypothetical protein
MWAVWWLFNLIANGLRKSEIKWKEEENNGKEL